MGQMVRFQETLRRLAMIDESFVEDEVGLGLDLPGTPALDPKTVALPGPGYRWPWGRPGTASDGAPPGHWRRARVQIKFSDVLLAIAPARVVDGLCGGFYTNAFEVICCNCGDYPDREYQEGLT
jgi:hypothetical protein